MAEGYNTEEIIESCLSYLKDARIGLPVPQFTGKLQGISTTGRKTIIDMDFEVVKEAHYSVRQHLTIMSSLVDQNLNAIHDESNGH
jgi:hypothetical protein